ncbi:MAG: hypothetical protein QF660_01500, partial [Anaerolineales bacterium]|nr:hypothetical protein [Anaerolineales bacterium]
MKYWPEKKVRDWKQERKRRLYRFLFSLQCLTYQTGPSQTKRANGCYSPHLPVGKICPLFS